MGHFTAAEADGHLEFVPGLQEFDGLVDLGIEVVFVDFQRQTHLFEFDGVLVFTGFLFALGLLEFVLAVVHDLTHRRLCLRCDFDQVQVFLFGNGQSFSGRHDPELFAVGGNDSDFLVADGPVDLGHIPVVSVVSYVQAPPVNTKMRAKQRSPAISLSHAPPFGDVLLIDPGPEARKVRTNLFCFVCSYNLPLGVMVVNVFLAIYRRFSRA